MATEIYNNRENDSNEWIIVTKGTKYITLHFATRYEGSHDYTITYPLSAEAELIATLNDPQCNIEAITEFGWGPQPVKVVKHEANR